MFKNKVHWIGILSLACYAGTMAGYYANKNILILPFEILYFVGICLTAVYLIGILYQQSKKKAFREGSHVLFSALIFLGILVAVYLIAARHHKLLDITSNKQYSLSPQTIQVLDSLENPLEILVFLKKNQEGAEGLEKVLEQFTYNSEKISFQFINPEEKPTLAEKYGIAQFGEIVVQSGEKNEKVSEPTEEALLNSILKLTSSRSLSIAFLSGHGEPSIEDAEKEGYSTLKKNLELENYHVSELLLLRETAIPSDLDVLVVAAPKTDLFENELQAIRDYIATGGSVLFLLDPNIPQTYLELVTGTGFVTKTSMIVDPLSRVLGGNVFTPVTMQYIPHKITENFRLACFFPTARMVDASTEAGNEWQGHGLAYTGQGSWAETDMTSLETKPAFDEGIDVLGPVPIVSILEKNVPEAAADSNTTTEKTGRIAAIGDSDFANNSYLGLSGNKNLLLNLMAWLAHDENLISIRKTQTESIPLFLTQSQQILAFFVPVILLPLLVLGFGTVTLLRLRKE